MANLAYYDRERFLNIWVVNNVTDNGQYSYTKGYSNIKYRGGIDGIIMRYEWLGNYTDCSTCGFHSDSRGKALIHEVGHYLGLFHTFQGECTAGTDSLTCGAQGDYCCDTRPTKQNFDCPVPGSNQCPGLPFYGSQPDPYQNYMSYANEPCLTEFTPDQVSVMHSQLSNDRRELVAASNVNDLALSCCLSVSWFNVENGILCDTGTLTFHAVDHDNVNNYLWRIYTDTSVILDTSLTTPSFSYTLSDQGTFHVSLSFIIGADSIVLERRNLVQLRACGPPVTSAHGNWFFGKRAGIGFRVNGPVADASADIPDPKTIYTGEGVISYSNLNGDLLFYGGGDSANLGTFRLYRSNISTGRHIEVNQNNPLNGHQSSSQGGLVIPFSSDTSRFHLFVTHGSEYTPGVYRTVLNRTLADLAVPGSINLNLPVPVGSEANGDGTVKASELITAVPTCDGNHWLILGDWSQTGTFANSRCLLVYLVTDSTVTYIGRSDDVVSQAVGQLKASPNGTKIAAPGIVFNFDRNTGALSTFKLLPTTAQGTTYYGCSFSPDSRLLYYTTLEGFNNVSSIYQYNLESKDTLLNRKRLITESDYIMYTALQLGPDNRIYVAKLFSDVLGVIDHPDVINSVQFPNACDYFEIGVRLKDSDGNGGDCISGLPNFIDALPSNLIIQDFSFTDSACGNVSFRASDACSGSFLWHFGDGDSSVVMNPFHQYADTGTYTVTLTLNGTTVISRQLIIGIDRPVITGDTVVSCNLSDLTHYTLANLDPEFTYQWSADGGTVVNVEDFENAVIQWDSSIGSLHVSVVNTLNQCVSADTILIRPGNIRDNTISLDSGVCFPGISYTFTGSLPEINFMEDSLIHFQWQIWNGTGWLSSSSNDTLKDITGITQYDPVHYRRKVFSQWCESFSDSIMVAPKIKITRHPDHVSRCVDDGGAVETFHLGTEFSNSWEPYKAYFVVKKFIDIVGYVYVVEDSFDYLNYPTNLDSIAYGLGYFTYEYFFKINTPCGYYYSDTSLIHGCYAENQNDWIVTMPDTTYTTEDSLVEFVTHYDPCNSGPYLDGSYIYWQNSNNGIDWYTINDTCGDTLRFTATYCDNGLYYRMAYHDPCYVEERYSKIGRLFVTRTNFAKLMMRDYYDDDGTEPNNATDWRNLYEPPSFLIRLDSTWGPEHELPNWETDTAYVYYTIHNIDSTDTSKPAKLKMYWTFGGPHGADWELAWEDAPGNRFYNDDPGSGAAYQQWHPYGDKINQIPIEVPSIAPGDSIRDYFMWTDFPNPLRYYVWQNGVYEYANPRPMCMLARIETCPLDSFGMSYKETITTRQNIINNRKIVGRNTSVTNLQWQYGKKETSLTVRRFAGDDDPLRVTFEEVGNCGFGSYGRVKAVLSDALWEAWRDGGYVGSGYAIDSYGILSITDLSDFEVGNIELDPDSVALLTFEFELVSNPFTTLNCRYAVAQYQGETSLTPYGTFVMNVNAIGEPEGGEGLTQPVKEPLAKEQDPTLGFTEPQELKTISEEQETGSEENNTLIEKSLFAYPNPFTNEVNFYFELTTSQSVSFEIYNGLGAVAGQIDAREYTAGKHKVMFDGSRLAPGMYLCRVQIGTETKTLNLVIAR